MKLVNLMIGNYIVYKGDLRTINEIRSRTDKVVLSSGEVVGPEELDPIPIDSRNLYNNLGASSILEGGITKYFIEVDKENLFTIIEGDKFWKGIIKNMNSGVIVVESSRLEYVHQVQNLINIFK